ncbi:MAG: GspH/FimT family pseudopilin [Pseudomonadota bacterium]
MDRARGFTLLELLVTLTVMGLLMVTAVPAYRSFSQNLELRASAQRLASDFLYARHAAMDRGRRVAVCPGRASLGCRELPSWADGWMVFEDQNGDRRWQPGEPVLRETGPQTGISIRSSAARRLVQFFANGSAAGSNATLWLCDRRGPVHGWQVRVSMAGRIRTTAAKKDGDLGC